MRWIIKYWAFWLLPAKFYGGGGKPKTKTEPQTNPEEQALAKISEEKWAEYKKRYVPLENQWIKQVGKLNSPIYHNQAGALASNEVKVQNGPQTQIAQQSLAGGRAMPMADYLKQAGDISQARTASSQGVTDRYLKGLEGVIAMGQGQSAQAIQGMSDVANTSVQAQIDRSNNTFSARQSNDSMYGTMAGGLAAAGTNSNTIKRLSEK